MTGWLRQQVRRYEQHLIDEAIQRADGSHAEAARALGFVSAQALYMKTFRLRSRREAFPDECWNDAPLAWVIRRDGDRVTVGACWTRDEIAADADANGTIAMVLEEGAARQLARDINTALAIKPTVRARVAFA